MCELTAAAAVTTAMMGLSGAQTVLGVAQQAQQAQQVAAEQSRRAWQASYQTAYQTAQARNAAAVSEYNAQDAERPRARRAPQGRVRSRRSGNGARHRCCRAPCRRVWPPKAAISRARRSTSWAMPRRWANRTHSPPAIRPHGRHGPSGSRPPTRTPRPISSPLRCRPGQPARIPVLVSPGRC